MRRMITFDEDHIRFTNRIVGIAFDRDRVLLHRTDDMNFWALPGGRAELLESSPQTLIREMQEEIGVTVQVDRLLWVVENLFVHMGWSHHELGLYFLMHLPADSPLRALQRFDGHEGKQIVIFEWHPLETLDGLPLYPQFLRTGLKALPATTTHMINVESAAESAQP
jgi:8-oxo-dGTP pyrophosphatase MutT (NUDIX family)